MTKPSKTYVCESGTPTVKGYQKVKARNRPKRPQDLSKYFVKSQRMVKPVRSGKKK